MGKTIYASSFGFLSSASADENREALQKALDEGGEIIVDKAGTYLISGTVLIGSNTRLVFSEGTSLKRVALECKYNGSVIMNRGAYTHEYDENIEIEVMLPPPAFLSMTQSTQLINSASQYADTIVEIEMAGESDEAKQMFKKRVIRTMIPSYLTDEEIKEIKDNVALDMAIKSSDDASDEALADV